MNVLYITVADLLGQQFNGMLLQQSLNRMGHTAHMAVAWRRSNESMVRCFRNGSAAFLDDVFMNPLERKLSLWALFPVATWKIYCSSYYRHADVFHLQLVHQRSFFSLFNVPIMSHRRPTVWTLHDPWLMGGHCVHPLDCGRWLTGCGQCPDLTNSFPIEKDTTAFQWKVKKWVMEKSRVSLVVASRWMRDRVRESPILSHLPCHLIPFGVDTSLFRPMNRPAVRLRLGIPAGAHVVACRVSGDYDYKGTIYVEQAMQRLGQAGDDIVIIAFGEKGILDSLRNRYRVIELGWVDDRQVIAEAMNAADIFLMPSLAESFGMMAIEAMACGTPVIAFDGTALPDVIDAPRCGLTVPYKDAAALANCVELVLGDPILRQRLSDNCLRLVQNEYRLETYVERHIELYESLLPSAHSQGRTSNE